MKKLAFIFALLATVVIADLGDPSYLAILKPLAAAGGAECVATNHMTILPAFTAYGNTSNSTFYMGPAFTPASNDLLVAFVAFSPIDDACTMTNTGTTQFTWTKASQTNYNTLASPANSIAAFYTRIPSGTAPFSMQTVFETVSGSGVNVSCLRISGTPDSSQLLQTVNVASNATANPKILITPEALGRNAILYAVGDDVNSASDSARGNWMSEQSETAYNTPATGLAVYWQLYANNYTSVTNIQTSRDWGSIALEIKAGTTNCGPGELLAYYAELAAVTNYVNTDSTTGGDGTTTNTTGSTRAYVRLLDAVDALPDPVTEGRLIQVMGTKADTTPVIAANWDMRTTNGGFIMVQQHASYRHGGVYDTSKYRIEITNESGIYNSVPGKVFLDGLQIRAATSTTGGSSYSTFRLATIAVGEGQTTNLCIIANCIAEMARVGGGTDNISGFSNSSWQQGVGAGKLYVFNCLAYGGHNGFTTSDEDTNFFHINCTSVSNTYNYVSLGIYQNCIAAMPEVFNFVATGEYKAFNNAADNTEVFGLNSRPSVSFTFVDTAAKNYKLQSSDTGAKDFGFTDPSYGIFLKDVTDTSRGSTWSIGFHEP